MSINPGSKRKKEDKSPHTLVLDQGLQLFPQALMPARDVHAQAVVAAGLAISTATPLLVGGQEAAAHVRAHMVNCGDSTGREGQGHSHEGQGHGHEGQGTAALPGTQLGHHVPAGHSWATMFLAQAQPGTTSLPALLLWEWTLQHQLILQHCLETMGMDVPDKGMQMEQANLKLWLFHLFLSQHSTVSGWW